MTNANTNDGVRFAHTPALPFHKEVNNYFSRGGQAGLLMPHQITGWQHETLSWKEDCYLHTMLSGRGKHAVLRGPDAARLLAYGFVNEFGLEKFPIGKAQHVISCAPSGNIGCDGMCLRIADDAFVMHTREPFVSMYAASGMFDVEPFHPDETNGLIFQIGGPRALEVTERATGMDLHDLKFMRFAAARIGGHDVRIVRMGMAGTLAYEVHAATMDHVFEIYHEVMRAGEPFGMRELGRLAYMCNHTENGFPQQGMHFLPDWSDPDLQAYMGEDGSVDGGNFRTVPLRGSLADEGRSAYHLNPFEAGWGKAIRWNHDFVGREALELARDDPRTRRVVTLDWHPDDVLRIFATYFDGEPGVTSELQFPQNLFENPAGNLQDKVVDAGGAMIGKSAGRTYTLHYKKMISMGFVDPDHAAIGTPVTVIWGEPGRRQVSVRATVARYPFLDLTPNARYPIDDIPRFVPPA